MRTGTKNAQKNSHTKTDRVELASFQWVKNLNAAEAIHRSLAANEVLSPHFKTRGVGRCLEGFALSKGESDVQPAWVLLARRLSPTVELLFRIQGRQ